MAPSLGVWEKAEDNEKVGKTRHRLIEERKRQRVRVVLQLGSKKVFGRKKRE